MCAAICRDVEGLFESRQDKTATVDEIRELVARWLRKLSPVGFCRYVSRFVGDIHALAKAVR
jgi:hypothetical protein